MQMQTHAVCAGVCKSMCSPTTIGLQKSSDCARYHWAEGAAAAVATAAIAAAAYPFHYAYIQLVDVAIYDEIAQQLVASLIVGP